MLPLASGDTLVVLGDISGKGLPAAMTVSLIVGALRTLAETTEGLGAILAGLNGRLAWPQWGPRRGFTTCLVLRCSLSGSITAANAGHVTPYRHGRELALPPEIPLGLAPDARSRRSASRLPPETI